ncbi:TetR/AcrR family transcriptional regulator [Nonomuraea sp. K274]|uniref:TetR/AcrR family transcriptional regulator n=1 Tax=Nonomuraea cypriaca TaxID=1187855 RepID=A0A931EZD7_9ACTN|nr:TetR/AcrR family transcriptional regulator [Nonomuraea cypriaca]MBF8189739.1 TetR/AcrR family transcriptional regulator [Nonomuraea cypriaca]
MAPRGQTRQRILDAAQVLFQRQGYHATGVNQILSEAGAPKGTLYFHFPGGKEELAVETVSRAADQWGQAIDAALAQADPAASAHAVTDLLGTMLRQSDFRDGCPLATVALEVAADSDQVQAACANGYQHWITLIAARLRERGIPGDAAADLAEFILSTVEGALLLARVQRDTTPLRRAATRLAAIIAQEIPPATGEPVH